MGHRGKPRSCADPVVEALLVLHGDDAYTRWTYPEDVADLTGLTVEQVLHAARYVEQEYEAVTVLLSTKAIRLREAGLHRYRARDRTYAYPHRFPSDREKVVAGLVEVES